MQGNQRTNPEFRFTIKLTGPKGPQATVKRQSRGREQAEEATTLLAMEQSEAIALHPAKRTVSRRRRSSRPMLIVIILLLLVGGGIFSVINDLIPLRITFPSLASATITITPDSWRLQKSYDLQAVTTPPVAAQQQIPARILSFTTDEQSITVPASGTGTAPATYASGTLTFQNTLSKEQTVPAGTVFIDKNGIKVANEQDAHIPGTQLLVDGTILAGTITVPAHALVSGDKGNIQQSDFNGTPSYISGITVENTTPFFGGQEQQTYHYVQQSDIDGAANTLQTTLTQKARTALLSKMSPDERLIDQIQYTRSVSSLYKAGETVGGSITVTVKVSSIGEVYNQRLAQTIVASQLQAEETRTLTTQYKLAGPITAQVISFKKLDTQGITSLRIQAQGLWIYQIADSKLQAMVRQIAGKRKNAAEAILQHGPGVKTAQIDLSLFAGNTLPQNLRQITLHEASTP